MLLPKSLFFNRIFLLVCLNLFFFTSFSQVGIGTVDPHPSSMLDVSSSSQGILAPRMTTAQRVAIANPANGLLVYDTEERSFYFYDETVPEWVRLNSSQEKRDNFVLVKSLADFPAPAGTVINLDSNTYYEINGAIDLAGNSINLNNAYLSGLDANEDVLIVGDGNTAFQGSTGGSIRNITITGGGTAFNISSATGQSLLVQSTIVTGMNSGGTISGLALYFSNIVQYLGNATGITYDTIDRLLLSNQAWFGNNAGTYETFTGTFEEIQKVGGFSTIGTGAIGIDVSSNPRLDKGIILGTIFNGSSTTYVDGYTTGSFSGFNFNNSWGVECPGISLEIDAVAVGNIYITTPAETTITTVNVPVKVNGTTTAVRMFRASSTTPNRIVYEGSQTKIFNIQASLSGFLTTGSNVNYTFFIARNGTVLPSTGIQAKFGSGGGGSTDVRGLSFTGTVELAPGQYIEVFVRNDDNTNNVTISRLNLLIY